MPYRTLALCAMLLMLLAGAHGAAAQDAASPQLPPRAAPTKTIGVYNLPAVVPPTLDPARATASYLARGMGVGDGDAFRFVEILYVAVAAAFLLWLRVAARIRDLADEWTASRMAYAAITIAAVTAILTVLFLPLAAYEKFALGSPSERFAAWLGDYAIAALILVAGAAIVLTPIYALMRRTGNWWIYGAGIAVLFGILFASVQPVFIAPLFNHYTVLPDGALKENIYSLARANGVSPDEIYLYDESLSSPRLAADAVGLFSTKRIALSDNLLSHTTHDEAMIATGREIGHLVMGHADQRILFDGLLVLIGFAFLDWGFSTFAEFLGGVQRIDDPAGLPLLVALGCVYLFVALPALNYEERTANVQADFFSLNAVRKPDALATLALRGGDPSLWEEFLFYDHPSARMRIESAMRWKAEHMADPDIATGPASPQ